MNESEDRGDEADAIRANVRAHYQQAAEGKACCGGGGEHGASCCGSTGSGCCAGADLGPPFGYTTEELESLPLGANLGLGCGHPTGFAELREGEVVLDLGCGAGIDCFLASKAVGPSGRVIGVDMTPEMLAKARTNARSGGYSNVEFRLGEIEHLPVADRSVDVVLSNCVINLAVDKAQVYREAFRTLRPGGRLAVADVVATRPVSSADRADLDKWSSCSSGALEVGELRELLRSAGFTAVQIELHRSAETQESLPGQTSLGVVPADVRAKRGSAS